MTYCWVCVRNLYQLISPTIHPRGSADTSEQKTFTSKWTPTQTVGPVDATGESYSCTSIIPALTQLQLSTFPSCTGFPSQGSGTCAGYFMSYCCSLQYKPTSLRGWIHWWSGQPAGVPGWSSLMQLAQWLFFCLLSVRLKRLFMKSTKRRAHRCPIDTVTHPSNYKNSPAGMLFQISHMFLLWGKKTHWRLWVKIKENKPLQHPAHPQVCDAQNRIKLLPLISAAAEASGDVKIVPQLSYLSEMNTSSKAKVFKVKRSLIDHHQSLLALQQML